MKNYSKIPFVERFEGNIELIPFSTCHWWVGATIAAGYGEIHKDRRPRRAHRIAYEMYKGPIPEGLFVCHSCDHPACVNPHHLFLGTHQDNMDDMKRKGRQNKKNGEDAAAARLTAKDVIQIRGMADTKSRKELGEIFRVHPEHIGRIITRKKWKHLA